MSVSGLLALQRAAGNHAVATMVQRQPVKEAKKVLSDTQVAQLADDVDRIQQELVRVEERGVAIDVGSTPHFARWVPKDELDFEDSRGAAKTYGYGEVKGVKPPNHVPTVH